MIEQILKDKTTGTEKSILFSQWDYDKKIAKKTLALISNQFPHYTSVNVK